VKKFSIFSSAAVAALGLLLCLVESGTSYAATYSTSTAPGGVLTLSAIGDEIGSPYDQVILSDFSSTLTTTGDYKINTLQFVVGPNCYSCNLTPNGTISEQLTIDGVTQTLLVPWSWASTGPTDTLYIGAGPSLTFAGWTVSLLGNFALSSGGGPVTVDLMAQFVDPPTRATPLPAALPLFASGLGALGLLGWRRKRKAAALA